MSTAIKFTYQDYLQLPEDRRYEIVDGDLFMVPAPVPYHQRVSRNLARYLDRFVTDNDLGEVFSAPCDLLLSETDVVQPDLFYISKARLSIITETNIQGAPDLIVEILSPATAQRDRGIKQKLYARGGVAEYWIVDPATKSVEVLTLKAGAFQVAGRYGPHDTLVSPLLPGLPIPLPQVF
jgi:Uma2 family endonuclease